MFNFNGFVKIVLWFLYRSNVVLKEFYIWILDYLDFLGFDLEMDIEK